MITPGKTPGFASYFVFLIVFSVGLFFGLSDDNNGCSTSGSSSCGSTNAAITRPGASMELIHPKASYLPGEKVEVKLVAEWPSGSPTGTIIWTPPVGAAAIAFPDRQPEPGGPPFVFKDVTVAQADAGIPVAYGAPPRTGAAGEPSSFGEMVAVQVGDTRSTTWVTHKHTPQQFSGAAGSAAPFAARPASLPKNAPLWTGARALEFNTELTPASCQDLIARLKSAYAFTALRLPVADEIMVNQSYELPLIESAPYAPHLLLVSGPLHVDMAQEIRHDATAWANRNLPAAPGELWVALGVKPDATA
jgi:hypothetical protein